MDQFLGFCVINHGAEGHRNLEVLAGFPLALASLAVAAAVRFERVVVTKLEQRVFVWIRREINTAAIAAIAPARPTFRDEFLPSECDTAMAAISGVNGDFCFVNKHGDGELAADCADYADLN